MTSKILLIDDEPQILKTLKRYLEAEDYNIFTAENGSAGLETFRKQSPPLVITDVRMPGMSGIDVLKEVKKNDCNTQVIVITGHGDLEISVEALRLDASDFIQKPVDIELLLVSVVRAFEKYKMRCQLEEYTRDLEGMLEEKAKDIKKSQAMLMQSEKLASIGQLAAGVAHEINNPMGFISSNLNTLNEYLDDIKSLISRYKDSSLCGDEERVKLLSEIESFEEDIDIEYILDDLDKIIEESKEGADRVKKIVSDLKDFSRVDHGDKEFFNINQGLESTLNVVWNELKYKSEVIRDYGDIPEIECYPQELNQVFMNILVNAGQAIAKKGEIRISTRLANGNSAGNDRLEVRISDTGIGIPEENLSKIFDPFFTTKPVGKGTGLGMNISYSIIEKHKGEIRVESEVGKGTTFFIGLPVESLEPAALS